MWVELCWGRGLAHCMFIYKSIELLTFNLVLSVSFSAYSFGKQGATGGKVNILGGHSIGHSKPNNMHVLVHVSYSERFTRLKYLTVQLQN
jgi:hypothetical protein